MDSWWLAEFEEEKLCCWDEKDDCWTVEDSYLSSSLGIMANVPVDIIIASVWSKAVSRAALTCQQKQWKE